MWFAVLQRVTRSVFFKGKPVGDTTDLRAISSGGTGRAQWERSFLTPLDVEDDQIVCAQKSTTKTMMNMAKFDGQWSSSDQSTCHLRGTNCNMFEYHSAQQRSTPTFFFTIIVAEWFRRTNGTIVVCFLDWVCGHHGTLTCGRDARGENNVEGPRTVRPKNISELMPRARKIEFESCKKLKTRSDSELSKEKWKNNLSEKDFFRNILGQFICWI